jgi:hypothetical protein
LRAVSGIALRARHASETTRNSAGGRRVIVRPSARRGDYLNVVGFTIQPACAPHHRDFHGAGARSIAKV